MDFKTPCKGDHFNEDSILFTPLPQATSTVDKRPDLLPLPEIMMEPDVNSPDYRNGYLSHGLNTINELKQTLDNLVSRKATEDCNSVPEPDEKNSRNDKLCEGRAKYADLKEPLVGSFALCPTLSLPDVNHIANILPASTNHMNSESLPLARTKSVSASLPHSQSHQPSSSVNVARASLELPSYLSSSFTPLSQVAHDIRKNTFKLDVLSNVGDAERSSAREKALEVIHNLDLVPLEEPDCSSNKSILSLQHHSFEPATSDKEVSGFSQILNKSDLEKDESYCLSTYGLPRPADKSLSFLSASQVSLDFMPPDDSLFRELGPSDPSKLRNSPPHDMNFSVVSDMSYCHLLPQETPKSSATFVKDEMRESSKNVKDLFSELDSSACSSIVTGNLDKYLEDKNTSKLSSNRWTPAGSISGEGSPEADIRVSDIAKALATAPMDATPTSLGKRVLELCNLPSAENSVQGYSDSVKCFYERSVVYGGVVHVDLESDSSSPQTLWSFQDLDPSQLKAVIKSSISPIKVLLFPLIRKNLIVKVQEVEFDRDTRYFSRLHVIKLLVENPVLEVMSKPYLDFGLVPECGVVKLPIKVRCNNSSVLVISPKFEQEEFSLFSVETDDDNEEIHLPPMQNVEIKIVIKPIKGYCKDINKIRCVSDQINLCLSPLLRNEILHRIPLKAEIYNCRLQIQDKMLEEPICPNEERQVYFKNSSPCPISIRLKTSDRFKISFTSLTLKQSELSSVQISYFPLPETKFMEGYLVLSIIPGDLDHIIKLKGKGSQADFSFSSRESSQSCASALGSSVNSSLSIGSSVEAVGSLQLECTSACLAWPSSALGSSLAIKSCSIRSKGATKEKLLIEVSDPSNSFYLVNSERECKKSEVVVLNPHERRKLSVEFSPKLLGQLKAFIIIKRVNSKTDSDSKKIVLHGFGGCGNLRALNIGVDLATNQCKLSLQPNFTQQFALQNRGDALAFFSLSQKKLEGMHIKVSPLQGLIGPGEIRQVSLVLQPESTGSEYAFFQRLLSKDKSIDIVLSSLTVVHGDESTRLRLARLFNKHKKDPLFQKSPEVTSVLKHLCGLFPVNKHKMEVVSSLKDPLSSLYELYNEGIQELTIDLTTQRKTIEEANLEVTQQFTSFPEHSVMDETEYTTFFDITNHPSHFTYNYNN